MCAVLEQEVEHFARDIDHIIHIEQMPQGLHNDPPRLQRDLQRTINRVEDFTDAEVIVLVYGLCCRGTEGVRTKRCKLVIARAHDCITLLLGCKQKYADYVRDHPGTYWYSPGWNKHHTPPGKQRYDLLYEQYRDQFGEDNAEYLMQTEQHWFSTYDRATYVDLTIGATDEDVQFTRDCADWLKWNFDHQRGDPELLKALIEGDWDDERFIVVRPGQTFCMSGDERVIRVVK